MLKSCKNCQQSFEITDEDLKFYEKISPVFNGKKYLIPAPSLCPDCRQQRRLVSRNERNLYKRKCDLCKKDIISIWNTENKKVYCPNCWYGDKWDSNLYWREFNCYESFFKQYTELQKEVPKLSLINRNSENSDYANDADHNKNCYLIFAANDNEDCYFSSAILSGKNLIDCFWSINCELSYEILLCENAFLSQFCFNCQNISECYFCTNCSNLKNCFGCIGMKNKEYYIFNKPYDKKYYKEKIQEYLEIKKDYSKLQSLKTEIYEKLLFYPRKAIYIKNCDDCNGDFITNSKNCKDSFSLIEGRDCKFIYDGACINDSYDAFMCGGLYKNCELLYETQTCLYGNRNLFSIFCWDSNNIFYSEYCFNCHDCFGCVGLNHKQYCILNKQYTKEEYVILVARIIERMQSPQPPLTRGSLQSPLVKGDLGDLNPEWGEFFPSSISPFGYNETVAQEYFPLTKEQALSKGFNWSDYEPEFPKVEKIIPANLLPDSINEIPDDILNWAILPDVQTIHESSQPKPFQIIKPELDFYRKMDIPIQRKHPDQRHKDRMALRNPRKLWTRNCMKCNAEIQTTYAPERPETVYCENCYLDVVY